MVETKSDQLSKQYKEQGNKALFKGDRSGALLLYNKAICYAKSKENCALAYANRSVVYLDRKKYDECLQNIQWARENNYPEDKIQKLNEREEKCKQLKAAQVIDPADNPWNFLRLSHPPNPKIPFIVDCLEMKVTEKYGRGIYATRDISTGDILSIEEPAIAFCSKHEGYSHCSNCLKTCHMNLIPCLKTASFMFCTEECRTSFYTKVTNFTDDREYRNDHMFRKLYGDIESKFGSREKLIEFLESVPDVTKWNHSVFDFDWSNPDDPEYGINQIKCFLSFDHTWDGLVPKYDCDIRDFYMTPAEISKGNKHIESMMNHCRKIIDHLAKTLIFGDLAVPFANLLNHSCVPNVKRIQVDNKIVVYATMTIKAGEQIFESYYIPHILNYGSHHYLETPWLDRIGTLIIHYKFECDCQACFNKWGPTNGRIIQQKDISDHTEGTKAACDAITKSASLKLAIEQWKLNNDFITKHHGNILSKDVHIVKNLNLKIISEISHSASYPVKTQKPNASPASYKI